MTGGDLGTSGEGSEFQDDHSAEEEEMRRTLRLAAMLNLATMFACAAYGQRSGPATQPPVPCTVDGIRLRIATGGDDLRGGNDNLNVTVRFGQNGFQGAPNVNNGANWPKGSVHVVDIRMNQPVPLNEIRSFTLDHLAGGGLTISLETLLSPAGVIAGFHTDDNWDMQSVYITAFGGGNSALIATHGAKRFTGSDPMLGFLAKIPANSCRVAQRFGHATPPLKNIQPANSTSSKYGTLKPAPSAIRSTTQPSSQQLQNNRLIQQALAHTVQIGPRASAPGGDGGYSARIGLLRKQSVGAKSLLLPYLSGGARPAQGQPSAANSAVLATAPSQSTPMLNGSGGTNQTGTLLNPGTARSLNPQPYPPKGSQPQVGVSQTMSATVSSNSVASTMPSAMQANQQSGPTRQQPAGGGRQPATQIPGSQAQLPTALCRAGLGSVDGAANGVWFSPVAGQDGKFVIDGCGFGNTVGEVYLSGVQYDPVHARLMVQRLGVSNSPDRVYFQIPPNGWTDRQIIVQIDANASGFYDTNNVTLNVKASGGQIYQAPGMNFLAARADQVLQPLVRTPQPGAPDSCYGLTLTECLIPGINLAVVNASLGPLTPEVESPTQYWLNPGQSVSVVRGVIYLNPTDTYAVSFPSGTDTYAFNFAPGFQFDPNNPVLLNHASMDVTHCESLGGAYANSGNWSMSYTSASSIQVHWEEESCSPASAAARNNPAAIGTTSGFAGLSVYELQVTVIGPRGVSPLASGKMNGLGIKRIQPVQMLPKN